MRFPRLTPAVKKLLIGLAGFFVLQLLTEKIAQIPVFAWLSLDPTPGLNWLWQPFTYFAVVPTRAGGDVFSVALSLFFAYLMLAPFEERYGKKRLWQLVGASVLGGALPVLVLGLLTSQWLAGATLAGAPGAASALLSPIPVFGTSCLVLGSIGAFAITVRGGQISFFGVLPMKAWHLIAGVLVLSALMSLADSNPFSFASALGAVAAGVAFTRWMLRPRSKKNKRPKKGRRDSGLRLVKDPEERPRYLN